MRCEQRAYARHSFAHTLRLGAVINKIAAEHDHDGSLLRAGLSFPGARGISLKDSDWGSDNTLRMLGGINPGTKKQLAAKPFPLLASVDVSGCQGVSSLGVRALVKALGGSLLGFRWQVTARHHACKEMKVSDATIKVRTPA